jgi:Ca2+-transporting ATPase
MNDRTTPSPWASSSDEIQSRHRVSTAEGLSEEEAERRRERVGPNALREAERRSRVAMLTDQFKSVIVLLLGAAGVTAFALDRVVESAAILVVLLVNGLVGFLTELRATTSMESLKEMTEIRARVRRGGAEESVPATELVPGDVVLLEAGDVVPADLRVADSSKLQADESALTGESVPVEKADDVLDSATPLAERTNMLYKGTNVTRGTATAVVVATGTDTELGQISESLRGATERRTPLQEKLDELGRTLVPFLLVVATVVLLSGWYQGRDLFLMVETAIALSVAAIPEGLPIIATLVLARGMWRMADRNALVKNLASVETLGSTGVVCTDKTGTLTENRMTVTRYELANGAVTVTGTGLATSGTFRRDEAAEDALDDPALSEALRVGVLCNNASLREGNGEPDSTGDPTEVALLVAGAKAGVERADLLESTPEVREVSFDPSEKMMATYHERNGGCLVAVKGAPEAVIDASTRVVTGEGAEELTERDREEWVGRSERLAEDGLRVLALARNEVTSAEAPPYEGLSLVGLVAMLDPPREEVKSTIESCRNAGMRIVMVTGDHEGTARNVARSVGLLTADDAEVVNGSELDDVEEFSPAETERFTGASVFARVSPQNKLDLIELHQSVGSIVAMTGDGVNDAPALKSADIGVAMGQRGTQVAREAADVVLRDDNFTTIHHAVREGRTIFRNIRKFVLYLLSCNLGELVAILIAALLGFPLPLLPLQILFLNVVTDVFPAFALGACEASDDVMTAPPRDPSEPILTRSHWTDVALYGTLISLATVGAFVVAGRTYPGGMAAPEAVTVSFLTLAFAQLWHVFNMRERSSGHLRNEVTANAYVWGAIAFSALLLVGTVYLPVVSLALRTAPIGPDGWSVVLGMSLLPLAAGQAIQAVRERVDL